MYLNLLNLIFPGILYGRSLLSPRQTWEKILDEACKTVDFAPMLGVLFLAMRMRAQQLWPPDGKVTPGTGRIRDRAIRTKASVDKIGSTWVSAKTRGFKPHMFETPRLDTPHFETPAFETPPFKTPRLESPRFETPRFHTPRFEAP